MALSSKQTSTASNDLSLPFPSLQEIFECYIRFLEPLSSVENKKECLAFATGVLQVLRADKHIANDYWRDAVEYFRFLESVALEYKRLCNTSLRTSHIAPLWNSMYLGTRDPLPFGWNYTLQLESLPLEHVAAELRVSPQALRASLVGTASFHFRRLVELPDFFTVESQSRMPKMCRVDPSLCNDQFCRLFRTVRIPHEGVDGLRWSHTEKVLVLHRGNAFIVDWIRFGDVDSTDVFKTIWLKEVVVNAHLMEVVRHRSVCLRRYKGSPLVLASGCRKRWARCFRTLWQHPASRMALDSITACSFGIALDDTTDLSQCLHGGAYPENRYPDMNVLYAIGPGGECSCNMEHSWGDGSTLAPVCSFIHYYSVSVSKHSFDKMDCSPVLPGTPENHVNEVSWGDAIDSHIDEEIQETRRAHLLRAQKLSLEVRHVDVFGTDDIKKRCKSSPDAFMHAALHIAQSRLFGDQRSTYCALLMKKYHHGRTETLRTVTHATQALAKVIESTGSERNFRPEVRASLHKVSEEHIARIILCRNGRGFHRATTLLVRLHREMLERLRFKSPNNLHWDVYKGAMCAEAMFFCSPALRELSSDYLSTSNMSAPGILSFSFAATHPDGVGVGYCLSPSRVTFTVSAFADCKRRLGSHKVRETPNVAVEFAGALQEAMKDLYRLTALPLQSKL